MCSVFVVHMFSMFFHVCFVVFLVGGVFFSMFQWCSTCSSSYFWFVVEQREIGRWDVPIRIWLVCVVLEKLNVAWPLLMMRKINYPQILIQEFYLSYCCTILLDHIVVWHYCIIISYHSAFCIVYNLCIYHGEELVARK